MTHEQKNFIQAAFIGLLRPIIRIALRNGLMYRELTQLCKRLYIEVAVNEYGISGRKTNTSRVALLTGLDRKEVKRLRDLLERAISSPLPAEHAPDRVSRVLSGWHQDEAYLNEQGQPKDLPIDQGDISFAGLVRAYGSDVPSTTILKELLKAGVIKEVTPGIVRAMKPFYIPASADLGAIQRVCRVIGDITDTLHHNLYRENHNEPARFERCATNIAVKADQVSDFRSFVNAEGQHFLERIDAWLTANEPNEEDTKTVRLGLGAYWIQNERFDQLN